MKIKVLHIGSKNIKPLNEVYGGSWATSYNLTKCFENDSEIDITFLREIEIMGIKDLKDYFSKFDIVHLDDYGIGTVFFKLNIQPDVMGPLMRSPIKNYDKGNFISQYSPEWFYNSVIIRLNANEEKEGSAKKEYKGDNYLNYLDKIKYIKHGVDTNYLLPNKTKVKKYILWAGDKKRFAKNYELWEEIKKITKLPIGYEFKELSQYAPEDYWNVLEETAICVNTSRYESFCCQVAESQSKGVPTIIRKELRGVGFYDDCPIQVDYEAKSYSEMILNLLENKSELEKQSITARNYAVENYSLKVMRDSFANIYKEIYKNKHGSN
jgi:glycosyltransferase involved in cell wall biosynthesis